MMTMSAVQSASPLSLNRSEISVEINQTASVSNHVNTQRLVHDLPPTSPHKGGSGRGGGGSSVVRAADS